jgi:2-amino-4-hydroxy-6-hydroxymethyldihydropteridine diphosphokinase
MHQVVISLAANRFQKKNLSRARQRLGEVLSDVCFTAEHWTQPMNTSRKDAYLNQIATGTTTMDEATLNDWLKDTELQFGRTEAKRRLGIVPIDLDLLQYDNRKHHLRDWGRSYVKDLISKL